MPCRKTSNRAILSGAALGAALVCLSACGTGGYAGSSGPSATHVYASAETSVSGRPTPRGASGGEATSAVTIPRADSPGTSGISATTTTTVTVTTVTENQVDVVPTGEVVPGQAPQALLTAASVGDADRRAPYLDFLSRHPEEDRVIGLDMTRRARIRVTDSVGRPVNSARIVVSGGGFTAYGRTHADGIWDLYPSIHGAPAEDSTCLVQVTAGRYAPHGQRVVQAQLRIPRFGDSQDLTVMLPYFRPVPPQVLDLSFVLDVTGSMEDELRYVNAEIGEIVRRIEQEAPETRVRVGATFYRDRTDPHVVQQIAFTPNVAGFARAMQSIRASGGGDYPEDMNAGLEAAIGRMQWTEGNAVRVMVLISDAPPKRYADAQYTYAHALRDAADRGIRVLPVAASGADRTVEHLFRAMGAFTSTPYVYLTDDSGIGAPHLEADTDRVAVEYLRDLLTRMVISDLRGEGMHEPGPFGPGGEML